MLKTLTIRKHAAALLFRVALWLRGWPAMAGAEESTDAEKLAAEKAASDKAEADKAAAEKAAADAKAKEGEKPAPTQEDLDKAYEKLRAAEARAEAAERKLKPEPKKDDPPKPKPGDKPDPMEQVTAKLRRSNLRAALADAGLTGGKGKAAMELLKDVEYDDDDEPTNLEAALTAAKTTYGEELFKAEKPKAPNINGGAGSGDGKTPELTADELKAAKQFGMTPEEYVEFKNPNPKLPEPAAQK